MGATEHGNVLGRPRDREERAMRVLIAAGFLGRFGETDGVVTTYRSLMPFFASSGHEIDIVAYDSEDTRETRGGVRLFGHRPRLPLRVDSLRRIDLGFAASSLARELSRQPYDVVQSSTPDPLGRWAGALARRQGCPFVAIYHTALAEYTAIRARRVFGRVAARLLGAAMDAWLTSYFNAADLVLAPSRSVTAALATRLRPPVAVLGRGVDAEAYHPAKRTRQAERVRALYVGRITPEKNLDLLVDVFAPRPEIELAIVGSGPSLEALRRRLPAARFFGRLEGEALARAYADADLFVFPSRTDTLGNVVLEAQASGLPVVVLDSMGPKELVQDGITGFVTRTNGEFARAVDILAEDPRRRERMARAARRFAETRSWRQIFDDLLAYYGQLVSGSEHATPGRGARPNEPRGRSAPAACAPAQTARASRPLCVLDVTEFFAETSGGVKTYLTQKARYVETRQHLREVLIVPGAESHVDEDRGVRWYHVQGPRVPRQRPYRLMMDAQAVRRIIERERPDVIEIGSNFLVPWIVAGVARKLGTPVVWFCHSNLPRILAPYPARDGWLRRKASALSRRYMRHLSRLCAATLAPSDSIAQDLEALGASNVVRVSLGVDVERFRAARRASRNETRARFGLPAGLLVLYVGRITREKAVDVLLDAWPAIESATGAHLALVGDGADLMASADLYVAPSVVETFGLAAIEAMACGTPVLSADDGAVADHVRRSMAGALFSAGSATSLAERANATLMTEPSALRSRASAYAQRHFSWPRVLDRIFGVYEEIVHAAVRA
jgi:alpha-1,6-mannosyltransferase